MLHLGGQRLAPVVSLALLALLTGCQAGSVATSRGTPAPSWNPDDGARCYAALRVIVDQWPSKWDKPFYQRGPEIDHRAEYVALLADLAAQIDTVRAANPNYFDAAWSPIVKRLRSYQEAIRAPMTADAFSAVGFEMKTFVADLFQSGIQDQRLDGPCDAIVLWIDDNVINQTFGRLG
jgi:hypothetical protein